MWENANEMLTDIQALCDQMPLAKEALLRIRAERIASAQAARIRELEAQLKGDKVEETPEPIHVVKDDKDS